MNHNLDFDYEDTPRPIGRLDIDANEFVLLEFLVGKGIHEFDGIDWVGQIQNGVKQTDQANLVAVFAENLAKCKIDPRRESQSSLTSLKHQSRHSNPTAEDATKRTMIKTNARMSFSGSLS
jgi:hypothetical protein